MAWSLASTGTTRSAIELATRTHASPSAAHGRPSGHDQQHCSSSQRHERGRRWPDLLSGLCQQGSAGTVYQFTGLGGRQAAAIP